MSELQGTARLKIQGWILSFARGRRLCGRRHEGLLLMRKTSGGYPHFCQNSELCWLRRSDARSHHHMRFALAGAVVVLAVAAPRTLLAQDADFARIAPSPAELMVTAALRPVSTALFAVDPPRLIAVANAARGGRRQGEILMIVGGAGILTGLLVDESLITIAGAAVGGYGLYLYLRATR